MNYDPYPIRFKPGEREELAELSRRLGISRTKVVRYLIHDTLEMLRGEEQEAEQEVEEQVLQP